ncbi:dynein regulatory complex protein 11 [Phlebotomus papatasi]|uniref:dynein regulatory complex protein 11 n=1 Tax=Phlebotomus papatasi TaxID=29031 RepID=UPI0024843CA6|nr:dynein regulatory complex protein 11 [Phlebotomus papatasi]
MSNYTYNKLWHETQKHLESVAVSDFENQALEPQFDKSAAQTAIFELYVKYICIANKLEEIYDQMVQPQKRLLVRKVLDACLGRVVELKADLVNIDIMEFSYNDEVIERLGLTPLDIEIRVPRYFRREREKELAQRRETMDEILKKLGCLDEEEEEEKMTELEAIRVIQMHERARQGRLRAQFMKEIRLLKEKGKPESGKDKTDSGLIAAMKIQKVWRGFATRKKTRRRKVEEMVLIGMIPPLTSTRPECLEKSENLTQLRYSIQAEFQEEFQKALQGTKEEINTKQGSVISEDIADEIRNWFKEYKGRTGKLPDFPSEEHGGSRHLLSRQGTESEMSRSSAPSSKESKKAKDKSKSAVKSGDINVEDTFENGYKASQSSFLPELKTGIEEFNDTWRDKDETQNAKQSHYEDMIFNEKYAEVEDELRKVVDDMMRQELELLQAALDRDRAQKGKKVKKSNKKARRSGKKGKKKKEKDLTPDRTTESLFEELFMNGIIKKYPETPLKSFLGDKSYVARSGINPTPGDIRQVIIEHCILPLGSEVVRNFAPCVRSILLTGSKGAGKRTLVNAICTEVGGTLFDLTPANIVGKYPGKSGLIMLMHLVSKVSRLLQPSVIYMGDAEKPFMKKIPKTDRTDPKRLKKDLPKLVKNIGPEDRVIFIGTSCAPWEADQKLLQQAYNRFIYIPRPDYGTLSYAWRTLLSQYSGVQSTFDSGAMAKISDGYTIGSVVKCLKEVITCKRMLQLRLQPLTHVELINSLSTKDPVYREEEEAFLTWWGKTPLGRRRQRVLELEMEARIEKENASDKAKKGAKKKK